MKMNTRAFCQIVAALLAGLASDVALSQESSQPPAPEVALFEAKIFKSASGEILPYRLFVPKGYTAKKRYPLVLWLHGASGRGDDNLKNISDLGAIVWVKAENQAKNPCIVVVPQCPANKQWLIREDADVRPAGEELSPEQIRSLERSVDSIKPSEPLKAAYELVESLQKTHNVDPNRLYVAGASMGGSGVWALIAAYPEKFAAAMPLCGPGAVPTASRLTKIAIWAFHGDKDPIVPVILTRRMIDAIKHAGGQPKYTELQGAGHNIRAQVFSTPEVLPWLFDQRR
jgi:predicted peptidase